MSEAEVDKKDLFKYNCETCKFYSNSDSAWKKHQTTFKHTHNGVTRNQSIKKYFSNKCPVCEMEFSRPDSIKRHMIYKHSDEKQSNQLAYKCELCNKSFYIHSLYLQHCSSAIHIKNTLLNMNPQTN